MGLVQRGDIPPCEELPSEEVPLAALGGSVRVACMSLPQLLHFRRLQRALSAPLPGETPEQTAERVGVEAVAELLATVATAADGLPVYSAAQWRNFAATHPGDFMAAGNAALRLSGVETEAGNS